MPPVTASGMREIDRIAVEETGPNLFQMMENAGRNLALQAIEVLGPDWRERHMLVVAGGGGNGGGGICAARHPANRGATVTLVLAAPLLAGGVPAFQYHVYTRTPGRQIDAAAVREERPDLLIDALIGYGLTTAPLGIAADLITWANGTGAPILSLDVPSGVDDGSMSSDNPVHQAHIVESARAGLRAAANLPWLRRPQDQYAIARQIGRIQGRAVR